MEFIVFSVKDIISVDYGINEGKIKADFPFYYTVLYGQSEPLKMEKNHKLTISFGLYTI